MLTERINSAVQLMETVDQVKKNEAENKEITQSNNTFFAAFETFSACMESYLLLKENNLWSAADITLDKDFVQLCKGIKSVFDGKKVFHVQSINSSVSKLNDNLCNQWKAMSESADKKIIDDLKILEQVSEKRVQLRAMRLNIESMHNWPVSKEMLQNYNNAKTQSELFLNETKFDQDIEDFLMKISERSATLSDLTPSIMSWLEKEKLVGRISLTIR